MRATTPVGLMVAALLLQPARPHTTLLTVPLRDGVQTVASPASVSVSADGRYVAFASYARLAPADTDDTVDIYVLDRTSGDVALESAVDTPGFSNYFAHPRLSGDGRYVVFETAIPSKDGVGIDIDIVVRDRVQHTTTSVTRRTSGDRPRSSSQNPIISRDGRIVVFESDATDLVSGSDANGTKEDVYAFEVATGIVRRVSVDSAGRQRAEGSSFAPTLSADGRFVAFSSTAAFAEHPGRPLPGRPCVGPSCVVPTQVYARDTQLGITTPVSVDARGVLLSGASWDAAISGDGRYVAFTSAATNLTQGDRNRSPDVFLRDLRGGATVLVSRSASGETANGASSKPALSSDGRVVAFQSEASNLICARRCPAGVEDINLLADVFLFDRNTGRHIGISGNTSGGWIEESGLPQLDATGQIIAFLSRHPIDDRDIRNDFDLFVHVGLPPERP